MEKQYSILVIGNGLIGSAAARCLGAEADSVALLGPPEPQQWSSHDGVFSSHYDEGRITRVIDSNPHWAEFAQRSIDQYPFLEKESGIRFFHPVGCIQGPKKKIPGEGWNALKEVALKRNITPEILGGGELQKRYPFFRFDDDTALLETGTAGYINPRKLVQAQNKIASTQGVKQISETALELEKKGSQWKVTTDHGNQYGAGNILLCTGAFTNALLNEPLPFTIFPRTVLFAKVEEKQREQLQNMPCIIWDLILGFDFVDIYLMPPILYPDGNHYIKIGGDAPNSLTSTSSKELKKWFQEGGSINHARGLKEILLDLMPELEGSEFHHKPCVTTYTESGYPIIDELSSKNLYTACAGCGLSAKSSNELGSIAARMILEKNQINSNLQTFDQLKMFQIPDPLEISPTSNTVKNTVITAET